MSKKSFPWLRLYTEFATDYKVQMMPESMQRRLIMLFCFQREGTLNTMTDDQISYRLGISKNEWKKTRLRFYENGFINENDAIKNGDDFIKHFALRQFDSDDAAKRKRKSREANKNGLPNSVSHNDVTTMSRDMSQNVTKCHLLDTDTDTDTDTEPRIKCSGNNILSSAEAENPPASVQEKLTPAKIEKVFISIPLVNDFEFPVTDDVVEEFQKCYPSVNVRQELREIRAWNFSKPKKRKTKRGIMAHINSWLSNKQNQGNFTKQNFQPTRVNNVIHNQDVLQTILMREDEKELLTSENLNLEEIQDVKV